MNSKPSMKSLATATVERGREAGNGQRLIGRYDIVWRGPDGEIKGRTHAYNGVTNQGIAQIYGEVFGAVPHIGTWYMGLIQGLFTVPTDNPDADTLASHAGWTEFNGYDSDTNREIVDLNTIATRTLSNSADVVFNITATPGGDSTVGGIFICDVITGGTGGDVLFSTAAIASPPGVGSGDTLNVTYNLQLNTSTD